ncbi:hypothetical protein [Lactobacillus sp. PSON]|uniref:hypothetical protein n=1 Tax=Lactobacillus sp. PSON TaxID=3455454 RepID=UPI0040429FB9
MTLNYDLIHKIEDEYGSISKIPENHPLLLKLQTSVGNPRRLEEALKAGYSCRWCLKNMCVGYKRIKEMASRLNVPLLPSFVYYDDNQGIYSTSKKAYAFYVGAKKTQWGIRVAGQKLTKGVYSWDDISVGAIYLVNENKFYRKLHTDIRSYKSEESKL